MRNLRPLRLNYSCFQSIVRSKHQPVRGQLILVENSISKEYKKYVHECLKGDLFRFNNSAYSGNDFDNLANCYSDIAAVKKLKNDIRDNFEEHLRYECQYCMIGDSSESFDHYLPQYSFPEFSVLSNNLIPCCSKCNTLKSTIWKDTGATRNIINFYYDNIPATQFLFCSITIRRGTPIPNFSIANVGGGINASLFRIIKRHYERLGLIDRFKQKSNTQITNVKNTLSQFIGNKTAAETSQFLINDSIQMKLSYGNNYWKAVLKEAMGNSIPFLNLIGF